jgi:hypothetical protein
LQPLLNDKLSELAAKYGGSKLVLHASEDEDGGSQTWQCNLRPEPLTYCLSLPCRLTAV